VAKVLPTTRRRTSTGTTTPLRVARIRLVKPEWKPPPNEVGIQVLEEKKTSDCPAKRA
jgi:hypothetical protein